MKGNLDYEEAAKGIKDNCSLILPISSTESKIPFLKGKKKSKDEKPVHKNSSSTALRIYNNESVCIIVWLKT